MSNKNRFIVPLVLGLAAVLFFAAAVVSAVVLKTSDKIVGIDYECNYSHNNSFISSIAAALGNRAAEFNNGICLMEKKEYGEAYDVMLSAAEKGLAPAQSRLGYMYAEGLGVTQDSEKSEHWYRMAANQGDIDAMVSLGNIYYGIRNDFNTAFHYYSDAAYAGDAMAQLSLAYMYLRGEGVEQDYEKAFKLTEKSAEQGLAQAQNELGRAYEQMKQDYNKAIEWYKKAAAQGYQDAQKNLDRLYENGGASQTASKKSTADDPLGDLDLDNLFTDEDTVGGDPFADLL